jgi:hypothetical protein
MLHVPSILLCVHLMTIFQHEMLHFVEERNVEETGRNRLRVTIDRVWIGN